MKKVKKALLTKEEAKKRDEEVQEKRDSYHVALKKVLSTPEGIEVFKDIFKFTKVFCSTYTGNSGSFFNEGLRTVGLKYFNDIREVDPNAYVKLMIERG